MARRVARPSPSARRRQSASTSRCALGLAAALALTPRWAAAQSVRGEVFSTTTLARLPYSTVILAPAFGQRFTDDSGRFAFAPVPPGTYRLTVKHIGYAPFDTVLTVGAGRDVMIRATLASLAVELPAVTVIGGQKCTHPGAPDPAISPQLAAIFGQLRENATRFLLLANSYPFRYWVLRHQRLNRGRVLADTVEYRSAERQPYKVGQVVKAVGSPTTGYERLLMLPNTADLADSAFHNAHCFSFGGIERLDSMPHLRVDFLAAERLRRPDVDGTAWLDSATFNLSRVSLRLTRAAQAANGVRAIEVTVDFGEILPSLILERHVYSVTTYRGRFGTAVEEQRFLRVEFLRGAPGTTDAPP